MPDDPLSGQFGESPRPGRRKRRKKPVLGLMPRFGLIVLVVGFAGVASVAIGAKIAQPYEMMHQERAQIASLKAGLDQTDSQNDSMQRQADYLSRPDGEVEAARAQGYVKPGEVSLIIEQPAASLPPAAPDGFADRMRRAWSHLMGR